MKAHIHQPTLEYKAIYMLRSCNETPTNTLWNKINFKNILNVCTVYLRSNHETATPPGKIGGSRETFYKGKVEI